MEDLVFDATAKSVLNQETVDRFAVAVMKKFNAGLQRGRILLCLKSSRSMFRER